MNQLANVDLLNRLRAYTITDRVRGCWVWFGSTNPGGYGNYRITKQKASAAHRLSWEIHNGPIPNGLHVCHHCDVRGCIRPDHLFLGTVADNMRDMKEKGRSATREKKKHCVNGHAFTPENTFKKENGTQGCKQCNRNRALKWKYEHLAQVREFQKIRARVKRKAERMKNANSL